MTMTRAKIEIMKAVDCLHIVRYITHYKQDAAKTICIVIEFAVIGTRNVARRVLNVWCDR
jgi:hypothetical protein